MVKQWVGEDSGIRWKVGTRTEAGPWHAVKELVLIGRGGDRGATHSMPHSIPRARDGFQRNRRRHGVRRSAAKGRVDCAARYSGKAAARFQKAAGGEARGGARRARSRARNGLLGLAEAGLMQSLAERMQCGVEAGIVLHCRQARSGSGSRPARGGAGSAGGISTGQGRAVKSVPPSMDAEYRNG